MANTTEIEFADRTGNAEMGCSSGCELSPKSHEIIDLTVDVLGRGLPGVEIDSIRKIAEKLIEGRTASEIFHCRQEFMDSILQSLNATISSRERQRLLNAGEVELKSRYVCFAHVLHLRFGGNPMKPEKVPKPGYAVDFENPLLTPGKVAEAVYGADMFGKIRRAKPWMNFLPTIIFVGDMGDNFDPGIPFDYLMTEVVEPVLSPHGQRCIFLWFSKQPRQMLAFAKWLERQGVSWPPNVVAVTSITGKDSLWRLDFLREIPARFRAISAEPLWEQIDPDLTGVAWLICGGQSGWYRNRPFDLKWARHLRDRCKEAGVPFFMKQFGNAPVEGGKPLILKSSTGGDWSEFPGDLSIREFPRGFYDWGTRQFFAPGIARTHDEHGIK